MPWVLVRRRRRRSVSKASTAQYQAHKEQARAQITACVEYFAQIHDFSYGRIAIKNSSSRWGSCSKAGNLNFNYRACFLPPSLLDYLVVHELCHLKVFNHSEKFWALVASVISDHKPKRRLLRVYEQKLFAKKPTGVLIEV